MKNLLLAILFMLSASNVFAQVEPCEANADYDRDVDGADLTVFIEDYNRKAANSPCPISGPAPVARTGQTTSWATGDDGDLEKGVEVPEPRFKDNLDGTVTDKLTGLIWLKEANCFSTRTWNNALYDSNGLQDGECGLTDGSSAGEWRLPNKRELLSLAHDGYYNPALSNTAGTGKWSYGDPFDNVQPIYYWSSTTYSVVTLYAWYVSMYDGYVSIEDKYNAHYVWPVRGGQ